MTLPANLFFVGADGKAVAVSVDNPLPTTAGGGAGTMITSDQISDATTIGKAVLTAADEAAARQAIGAGTSSLALGTTSATAMAGDKMPTSTERGGVLQQAAIPDMPTEDVPDADDINTILAALRAAGILAS
jgi:hypothetical protein